MATASNAWLEARLGRLAGRPRAQARLLLCSTDLQFAWQRAEELGNDVDQLYWEEFSPYGRGHDFLLVNDVATQLLEHDRPLTALSALHLYLNRKEDPGRPSTDLITQGLETLVHLPADHREPVRSTTAYDIERLLDYLRANEFDEDRLATLEWQLLPARQYNDQSPILERRLARDPAFFIDILSLCFRPRGEAMEVEVPEGVASSAFRLLHSWKVVPGSEADGGEVDEAALTEWITAARNLAVEKKRIEVCDVNIGQVFAHARADADETWPTFAVRNVIENVASESLENGFWVGINNKRGFTSRGLTDGGKQEHDLAAHFDELAQRITDRWTRTAAVLRGVAESYRAQGRREDEDAERFKRGLDLR